MQDAAVTERIRLTFLALHAVLDEQSRRKWAEEARDFGYEGVTATTASTG
jgi:hypothetical protein